MRAVFSFLPFTFVAIACASARPIDAAVVQSSGAAPVVVEPTPAPTARVVSPAPGVTLLYEDLTDLYRDATVSTSRVPYNQRVAAAANALGVAGEETDDATLWRAVGARHIGGPFNCYELAVLQRGGMQVTVTDRRFCGLPYGERTNKPYSGPGPRFTRVKLERLMPEIAKLPPDEAEGMALARLGPADVRGVNEPRGVTPSARTWSAIGARDAENPITCHVLVIGKDGTRIEKRDLGDCGITWPPPDEAFATEPVPPPALLGKSTAECSTRCSTSEVCVIDERVPKSAQMINRNNRLSAVGWDGRPVPVEIVTSCAPIPPACGPTPTAACFFGPPQVPAMRSKGPCPPADNFGYSFTSSTAVTGKPLITCYSRTS